ncbi:hypothetical protein J437_LFUL011134 [Ladona fulva]|uniref:Uncharacterized protein n=1 Tax=Ladona fulva TaxID=123851 RepID=A0A8K0KBA7_LADFU|nr:hypothetical protein J437_LFUL011134 [Ladona fulva]
MEVGKDSSKADPSKISPLDFIAIVNSCLTDYYGNPFSLLGSYYEPSRDVGKVKSKEDFDEFCRSRSFTSVFEDLIHSNHWHQAIDFLSNCVAYHIPQVATIQKILDMMLVIDDSSFVMAAQMYLYQLISYHSPTSETLQQYYHAILKEEQVEEKRVSSPKDPCGSFINVIHQFATELEKMEVEKRGSVVTSYVKKGKLSEDDNEEGEDEASTNEADFDLLDLCDLDVLTGKKLRGWWINASSENRIYRLLSLFVIMMEIFHTDLGKFLKRRKK